MVYDASIRISMREKVIKRRKKHHIGATVIVLLCYCATDQQYYQLSADRTVVCKSEGGGSNSVCDSVNQ